MNGSSSQREILESLHWPDGKQRLQEQAQDARNLNPTERLLRVGALSRLCHELAAAAGNLDAAQRDRDRRESQWRDRIHEVIRQYESRHSES
jgi:hypothetical protein